MREIVAHQRLACQRESPRTAENRGERATERATKQMGDAQHPINHPARQPLVGRARPHPLPHPGQHDVVVAHEHVVLPRDKVLDERVLHAEYRVRVEVVAAPVEDVRRQRLVTIR